MTQPTITDTHTWDGSRALPTWLHPHQHRWNDDGQLLIHHPDGDTHPQPGWLFVGWSDGTVTVASPTTAERVYGPDGIHGRLERAEATVKRVQAVSDEWGEPYHCGWLSASVLVRQLCDAINPPKERP